MSTTQASRKRHAAAIQKLSYSVESACEATELSRTRIFAAMADGSLPSFRVGKRRMISAKALHEFIEKLAQHGEAQA